METLSSREVASASPTKARWELDWVTPDKILKIAMFDEKSAVAENKGASAQTRERVSLVESSMTLPLLSRQQSRFRMSKQGSTSRPGKMLTLFSCVVRSVVLLLRCFKPRRKIVIQSGRLIYSDDVELVRVMSSDRSSLRSEVQLILSTPPEFRTDRDIRKVAFYLKAIGAIRAVLGHTSDEEERKISRCAAYERYENGRMVAQKGRNLDRFYYVINGKILLVNEYHVGNNVISKTTSILGKGDTTDSDEMMKGSTRSRTMICRGIVEVIVIDRDDYMDMCEDKGGGAKEYLSQHKLLRLFPPQLLHNDGTHLQLKYYRDGEIVFPGGSRYDWVYVIKSGECAMVRAQLVNHVPIQKRVLFNKRTAEELGCERMMGKRKGILADFRMWRRQADGYSGEREIQRKTRFQPAGDLLRHESISLRVNGTLAQESDANLPPISDKKPVYSGLNPIDATMAGIDVTTKQVLRRSRMVASLSRARNADSQADKVESMRRTHLELGRLRPGDVFGLDDLYGSSDDVTRIALLSNGAEVVRIKRGFFLRHAPANLLIKLSGSSHEFPTTGEARASLEAVETWTLYKASLLNLLTSGRNHGTDPKPKMTSSRARHVNTSQRRRAIRTSQNSSKLRKSFATRATLSAPVKRIRDSGAIAVKAL